MFHSPTPNDPYNANKRLESLFENTQLLKDKTFNILEILFLGI